MDSYINLDIAVAALQNSHERRAENLREEALLAEDIRLLKELPTADVRPVVRGEWVIKESPLTKCKTMICPHCGYRETRGPGWEKSWGTPPFCENCGADMRGGSQ